MPRSRLTRHEMQAKTRRLLMEAAGKVCSKRGLQQASIDEVAETAGFTKGAFYANFRNKEELFLSMLDERFGERLRELDELGREDGEPVSVARQAGFDIARHMAADPEWNRLFFEFAAYAARNPEFRTELITRYRTLQQRIADVYRRAAGDLGGPLPVSIEHIALMSFAMVNGIALEQLLEPEAVPEDMYATLLTIFVTGLRTLASEQAQATPASAAPR
ncbi:MAG TPA: TetR family transcriptional regulator C-terminal domain-containing protein [Solirubrobacteraceae bacterium]|jgi:AcrR family transcriptional regulator|nr:TetR family transcriptional regulator C-terminal domain-containing protein [Solirubrobacteraceae bacterium]